MFTVLTLAATLLLQAAPPAGQADSSPTPGITLDFMAMDADGKVVADLSAPDVTLKIGGKVRPLRSLELVSPAAGGRNILLFVDEPTLFALEPVVKDAVSQLVASLLPGDRIAYVSTRRGRLMPLSPSHNSAIKSLEGMVTGPGVLWTCMADMVQAIQTLVKTLPPGRSTSFAVLSRGSSFDPEFGTDGAAGCAPRKDALRKTAELISTRQINLHLLTVDEVRRSWGMDTLASNTGGLPGLLTWSDAGALERAVRPTSQYYRATFDRTDKDHARPQRVELRVSRPKVKVRTSSTIQLPPARP